MKIPLGLAPQRSNVLPSLRVLIEEAKLQVPTSRPEIESGGCVGSAPARDGIAAAAMPMSAINSRLSIAIPAVIFFSILAHRTASACFESPAHVVATQHFQRRRLDTGQKTTETAIRPAPPSCA